MVQGTEKRAFFRKLRKSPPRVRGLRPRSALLLALLLALAVAADAAHQLRRPLALGGERIVEVAPGAAFDRALRALQQQGLLGLRQAFYLSAWARMRGQTQGIRAGEYALEPGTTPLSLLELLLSGRVFLRELRIIEGWRFADALRALHDNSYVVHTLPADGSGIMAALGAVGPSPEGRFFPDTYRFPRGTSDVVVLRQAFEMMNRRLQEAWPQRDPDLPYAEPQDALIMASLIEKETALESERPQIAGVFVRRLRAGMRLQTDPTVIYGLGDAYDGRIHTADLRNDTPYNTYTRDGLPPTPICLPGAASLVAALHPAPGDALYFVARGDGSHQFSGTLAEHDAAVRRYQLSGPANGLNGARGEGNAGGAKDPHAVHR